MAPDLPLDIAASVTACDDDSDMLGAALEQQRLALWLQQVLAIFARKPRWWQAWLPQWLWRRVIDRRIAQQQLFDSAGYLKRYSDIVKADVDPLVHFIRYGLTERRDGGPARGTPALRETPDAEIAAILASGMFDPEWYRARYGVPGDDRELLHHYLLTSARDLRRQPGPLFSGVGYLLDNPDVQATPPLGHYVQQGRHAGRRAWTAARADAFIAGAQDRPLYPLRDLIPPDRAVVVLHWRQGNFFFADVARYIAEVLADSGYHAIERTDHADLPLADMTVVIVAPHEYCVHGPGAQLPAGIAAQAVHVNTEQWHTPWFTRALVPMLTSRRALDINPASARGLARLGIRAGFLPLLPRPGGVFDFSARTTSADLARLRSIKPLTYPAAFAQRPYDVMFAGALNRRRARALAQLAPVLASHDCFLHAPRLDGPMTPANPNLIGSHDLAQIARNSRILLNIHQGDSHYFEWHRLILSGIAQGCVPLTEPCTDGGMVTVDTHYIAAPLDQMPAKLDWLLNTTGGSQALALLQDNGRALMARLAGQLAAQMP